MGNNSNSLNDYNVLAGGYQQTSVKPDKQYSTLPTVLSLVGDLEGKEVLDLGCGAGFFTTALAYKGAARVIGIDNSTEQLALANRTVSKNIEYLQGDIFDMTLPRADTVVAPYVLNYAETLGQLQNLFEKIFYSLNPGGILVAVIDLPEDRSMKRFGAIKVVQGEKRDGASMDIQLFNDNQFICTLHAIYFTPETMETLLKGAGFVEITWHEAILSEEGITTKGAEFWSGYLESPELGYLVAKKVSGGGHEEKATS